ncbi:hypothetical protein BG015_009333 [Linnemannia schmuckeri]|uniref:Uncharacterized protein n=1 Tax=Linnemannia schmuckeri TaxID=64567 RepID=A0A9P5S7A9_9FUNG|nr:hypothetical protein BG015_009333 [Linnemannia schmuckeri]
MSLPLLVACTSVIWALSTVWTSSPTTTFTSVLSTVAMCSSALFYLYYHTRRRSSSSSSSRAWAWGLISTASVTAAATTKEQQQSTRFITLDFLSPQPASATESLTSASPKQPAQPPFLITSSNDSNSNKSSRLTTVTAMTTSTTASAQNHQNSQSTGEQTHEHSNCNNSDSGSRGHLKSAISSSSETINAAAAGAETTGVTSVDLPRAGLSALRTVSSETLEALRTHPDDRIWDHIIVGGTPICTPAGFNTPDQNNPGPSAAEHPTQCRTDCRAVVATKIEQAQKLWTLEALQALPHTQHALAQSTIKSGSLLDRSKPVDILSLPSNISIGSGLCATRILIDQPVSNSHPSSTSTDSPTPHPVMRLNSIGESQQNILTIDTSPLAVPRAVGLEVNSMHNIKGPCHRLFCKTTIVFANHKHPLLHTLDTITTPPTSSAWRRSSSDTTEDPSRWPRMVFSIRMQYFQQKKSPQRQTEQSYHPLSTNIFRHLLASTSSMLDKLAPGSKDGISNVILSKGLQLEPIPLHQSDHTVHNGRVGPKSEDSKAEGTFRLEISASRTSLDISTPIEVHINVITQPMPNNTFGNTEAIRNGEAVLIDGLVMARNMAHRAGWTCQEEDESEMIEWVRDQMDIQWLSETSTDPDVLMPVCSTIDCVQKFKRARTFSNGSIRVRTPNLSPYASRTHSYHDKRKEDHGLGIRRDTTLSRLQEVSANLKKHKASQLDEAGDLLHTYGANGENNKGLSPRQGEENGASKVSIDAAESVAAKTPLKTSFGGFSSLNESRSQTLALAEMTEDHLGLALSAPSPPLGSSTSTSSKDLTGQEKSLGAFSDGVTTSDLHGTVETAKPSPPPGRSLSRFSIKSYQLERSNHGLGDEWALGNVDLSLGSSTPSKGDFLLTPPLSAERRSLGGISPLSPSPATFQTTGFLQDLSSRADPKINGLVIQTGSGASALEEPAKSSSPGSNTVDNSSRRSFGVFGPRSNGGISKPGDLGSLGSSGDKGRKSPAQLLEEPVELIPDFLGSTFGSPKPSAPATFSDTVPDFLGASFGSPKSLPTSTFSSSAVPDFLGGCFGSPPKRGAFVKLSDTGPSLERNHSSPSAVGSTKVVHFADIDAADQLRRIESDPISHSLGGNTGSGSGSGTSDGASRRSSGSSEGNGDSGLPRRPSMSKSKAHTRRSWGQGIGGHDIQGIQGLE